MLVIINQYIYLYDLINVCLPRSGYVTGCNASPEDRTVFHVDCACVFGGAYVLAVWVPSSPACGNNI